ncbi:MAG: hypothetical protein ACKOKG_00570 [Verrucomicrobiota bacterium]
MRFLGASGWGCHSVNPSGQACFLKFIRFATDETASAAQRARSGLLDLGPIPGLIRLRACGLEAESRTLWEELEPADSAPTAPADGHRRKAETLADRIQSEGVWSTDRVIRLGQNLCQTLNRLHGAGFIHGDI